jgi:NADH:ubiquinone oxidoreductase subunit F (NADH-binding)
MSPSTCVDIVEEAGIRGRGGAWFPAVRKWRAVRDHATSVGLAPVVVVNAAEGEPGSYKDRTLLARDPHSVIDGAVVAAHAVGADTIVIATKGGFEAEIGRLRDAIAQAGDRLHAVVGETVIVEGPDRYLYGEESALLEVVAGRPPFPRVTPPWRRGIDDAGTAGAPAGATLAADHDVADTGSAPSLVHNVETLVRIAHAVRAAATGTGPPRAGDTFLATVTGDVLRPGVVELPIGVCLDDVVAAVGGAPRPLLAALNGVSSPLIPASWFELPLLADGEPEQSVPIGAGAFILFDTDHDPVAIAAAAARFLSVESCGQCEPCKRDGLAIHAALEQLVERPAPTRELVDELDRLARRVTDEARCGLAGQQEAIVDGLLAHFPDTVVESPPVATPVTITPLRAIDETGPVWSLDHLDVQPDWSRDDSWSGRLPADAIDVGSELHS